MDKKERILKAFILLLFFGCSQKYVDAEGVSLDDKVVDSWEKLDCKIIEQDERGFSLNCLVKDIVEVKGSAKIGEFSRREEKRKADILVASGMGIIYSGFLGSYYYVKSQDYLTDEVFETGCFISSVSCLTGLAMIVWGGNSRSSDINSRRDFIEIDTICVDSMLIPNSEMEISVEKTNFKKTYLTDKNGNLELKFDEIIPEPTEADSVLNLIIKYEDMVDTVEVILDSRQ